jgi:hypothetical protein
MVRTEVPESLLVCQAAPAPPAPPFTDTDLSLWIVDLASAGDDCRARLRRVRDLVIRDE